MSGLSISLDKELRFLACRVAFRPFLTSSSSSMYSLHIIVIPQHLAMSIGLKGSLLAAIILMSLGLEI
jgi:hypothetical protein